MLSTGTLLQGRYRIIQALGRDGFATVYLARDDFIGNRTVAIEQFNPFALPPHDQIWATQAFEREARILAQLNHPALTPVTDYFTEQGMIYLVMGYVQGETLAQLWRKQPHSRFDSRQVMEWAKQLCAVLEYLHNQSPPIIFCDLKPDNIMVLPDGRLMIIDFGIARYFKPDQNQEIRLGTVGYAAPEQYGRGQIDARSDIYSLGVFLYQLLTGYDPTRSPLNLPPIHKLRPDISVKIAQAIEQAIQLDPKQRHTSVRDFATALGILVSGSPGQGYSFTSETAIDKGLASQLTSMLFIWRQRLWGFWDRIKSFLVTPRPISSRALPPSANVDVETTIVKLEIAADIHQFTLEEQSRFIVEVSHIVNANPDDICIKNIISGSVIITLEMPEEAAVLLLSMFLNDESELKTLPITKVELIREPIVTKGKEEGILANHNYQHTGEGVIGSKHINLSKLRDFTANYFNETELRDICFDLNVDYESLPGQGKRDKARELVAFFERRGQLDLFISTCREQRPYINITDLLK